MTLLKQHNATATFFFVWRGARSRAAADPCAIIQLLCRHGHEVGVHFSGRWGCCMSDSELCSQVIEAVLNLERITGVRPRYVRMPGGFSRRSSVDRLRSLRLTVVNGTAYPFDVDLCASLDAATLGRAAADLGARGGRIAILHDRENLIPKVKAFLEQADCRRLQVVRLDALLDDATVCHSHAIPCVEL